MTTFQIKVLAVALMVIDHIGLFFFPDQELFRHIGRAAFPLFAWLIANGAYYTHNIQIYLKRLLTLAVVSQVPFTLANQLIGSPLFYLNVVFTLFLGLLTIGILKRTNNIALCVIAIFTTSSIANIIHSDYGAAGVLSVVFFYVYFNNKVGTVLSQVVIWFILPRCVHALEGYWSTSLANIFIDSRTESYGLISLLFILLYNNKVGIRAKYLFYIFYPVQYIIIYTLLLSGF